MSELERRYRRLLALYPRDHRKQHGEEMLDVLVAAGGARTRPGWKDTADLVWGAFRLHLRRMGGRDRPRAGRHGVRTLRVAGVRGFRVAAAGGGDRRRADAVGAVAAAGVTSRAGRRAALVLLVPVMTAMIDRLLVRIDGFPFVDETVRALIFYGPPLVVLAVLAGLSRGTRRRTVEPVTGGTA